MTSVEQFSTRIEQELSAAKKRQTQMNAEAGKSYSEQQKRYELFKQIRQKFVSEFAKPRLEKLATLFPRMQGTPESRPEGDTVSLKFPKTAECPATVTLKLSLAHDSDIRNVVLTYDLEILPVFLKFDSHAQFGIPVEQPDYDAASAWLDDLLVKFVHIYLSIQFMDQYQQDNLVTDPVSRTRFPEAFAAGSLQQGGKTYFFMCDQTRQDFQQNPSKYV
jgi:YHS domain-containing protein